MIAERDGHNPVERRGLHRVYREIPSLPASPVVQLALWPERLADWAKSQHVDASVVYNCLAGHKPYHRVRRMLARRLGVGKGALDALIDRTPREPAHLQPPDPTEDAARRIQEAANGGSHGHEVEQGAPSL